MDASPLSPWENPYRDARVQYIEQSRPAIFLTDVNADTGFRLPLRNKGNNLSPLLVNMLGQNLEHRILSLRTLAANGRTSNILLGKGRNHDENVFPFSVYLLSVGWRPLCNLLCLGAAATYKCHEQPPFDQDRGESLNSNDYKYHDHFGLS